MENLIRNLIKLILLPFTLSCLILVFVLHFIGFGLVWTFDENVKDYYILSECRWKNIKIIFPFLKK